MLKPTQNSAIKKTKLGRKYPLILAGVTLVVIAGLIALSWRQDPVVKGSEAVQLGKMLDLEVVDTLTAQQKGLSGRESLADNAAMLFSYDEPGQRCIWMKDMKFSIDIVWLDGANRVTKTMHNVAPETYPESFCGGHARYVIEMSAGRAETLGVAVGQVVSLAH